MEYIFLFYTHSGAIKFQRKCKKNQISCELMPVPRILSSNCSICARIELDKDMDFLIDTEVEEVYKYENNQYELIYKAD